VDDVARGDELARVAASRNARLIAAVRDLDDALLIEPSELANWSRLTVVCHLRYNTRACLRMTRETRAGRETSYYPGGRQRQRPTTLVPAPHEPPRAVLDDWESASVELDEEWGALREHEWAIEVVEPANNPDLGRIPLARLALARLTEVDVHGTDLGIGVADWSRTLVEVGLPTRLHWLAARRTNHRSVDRSIRGSWLLVATDGPTWLVTVAGDRVDSRPSVPSDDPRAVIEGSARDLLALLLGRPRRDPLRFSRDMAFARSFERAFPGP
jgi:uncharacterized protein (TIGR03083 family)